MVISEVVHTTGETVEVRDVGGSRSHWMASKDGITQTHARSRADLAPDLALELYMVDGEVQADLL